MGNAAREMTRMETILNLAAENKDRARQIHEKLVEVDMFLRGPSPDVPREPVKRATASGVIGDLLEREQDTLEILGAVLDNLQNQIRFYGLGANKAPGCIGGPR